MSLAKPRHAMPKSESYRSQQQVLCRILLKICLVTFINVPTVGTLPSRTIKEPWTCSMLHVNKKRAVPGSCVSYLQCNWNSFDDYQMTLHDCPKGRSFDPFFTDCVPVRTSKELTVCPQKTNPSLFKDEEDVISTTVKPVLNAQGNAASDSLQPLPPLAPLEPLGPLDMSKNGDMQKNSEMPQTPGFPQAPGLPGSPGQPLPKPPNKKRRLYHEPFVNMRSIGKRVNRFPF